MWWRYGSDPKFFNTYEKSSGGEYLRTKPANLTYAGSSSLSTSKEGEYKTFLETNFKGTPYHFSSF